MIEWMLESENRRNHEPKNVVLFVKKNQKTHRAQIGCDSLIVTWKQRGWRWWAAPVRAVRRAMGRRRRRAPTEPTLTKPTRRGRGCRRFCRRGRRRSPARAATTNTSSRTSRRLCPVAKKKERAVGHFDAVERPIHSFWTEGHAAFSRVADEWLILSKQTKAAWSTQCTQRW